ncbi:MAG: fused MFS/spermidine synthase [Aquabacterium sp.]|uniref:fused MFS/spermidine synthase n=1 Tax=Aquabacterium sp. TaxID=1872578 RepID=UPI0025BBE88B|nr:fused MFS/spermidine synthase [Aquabacterium sp.]MBI5924107.1 fused MFS/spermidine synthase [Aquabacterium sp.]
MNDTPIERPRLHTNSQTVSLSFESSLIQSCMRLDAPDELVLDYTRAMMGFLLFNSAPRSILMIGLGGGSMLKYLHKHLPDTDLTVVEISQDVIDMRHEFLIPPDSERLRIVCDDGARFVRQPPQAYDVILVDGFTGQGLPEALCSRSFYQHCRAALAPNGWLVANVQADTEQTREVMRRLSKAFSGGVISAESDEGGNDIAIAGSLEGLAQGLSQFETNWAALPPIHQEILAVSSSRFQRALLKSVRLSAPPAA